MAIWMEIRCEARTQDFPEVRCHSLENAGPMGMANETQLGVIDGLRNLGDQAKRGGWVKMKAGWVCPDCASYMHANNVPASVLD